ncbi:acetyltransferase (GNAT) family protein [Luteibacter rhizovicinus]|uniref:Acetyltransferase (GNAT) family protein n=1 Tax=Luteibacter rhizovicinus TaxID=242606 RepID=A0A4R3Z037_9GAMM|nr:GNAT family N-acetyltransferase [Luteibacter rhizovicinus]TCV97164.1 acetyltransferase (GNAT) family protein [Luteibacter rhizovicinus]
MSELRISADKHELDVGLVHAFLSTQSTWAKGIPRETVERSIEHSICFGGYVGAEQVAFARVITDQATFAYLVDVFVLPEHRGSGYAKALMAEVMAWPSLQGLRRFMLATWNAHALYAPLGFAAPGRPETLMERYHPDVYTDAARLAAQNGTS